jgi:hypothetical protein
MYTVISLSVGEAFSVAVETGDCAVEVFATGAVVAGSVCFTVVVVVVGFAVVVVTCVVVSTLAVGAKVVG